MGPLLATPRETNTFRMLMFMFQTAFLEVVIPPDIVNEDTSGDMMVPEGGSAKFICKAGGYPKPKITWRREDAREIIARETPKGKIKGEKQKEGWLVLLC